MFLIKKYFPNLNNEQLEQFDKLEGIYKKWNEKVNLISRKDIDSLYLHHVLPSLSIAKAVNFKSGTRILDVGTGGGFPGVPLAIMFPEVQFCLIDSIGKKIDAVNSIIEELGLENVKAKKARSEEEEGVYDFVVGRAVSPLDVFYKKVKDNIKKEGFNEMENGVLYLGDTGNIKKKDFLDKIQVFNLENYFEEEYFRGRKLLHCSIDKLLKEITTL
ncbi:MAG: 16S rRNA (guanine(527)-N(7))-methyltransferase RsmG [Candidatus Moranbacteria bacterium]|nr:16S rRNA (guanine(527)-N(7))-methyltransferase RsmG [Candidatus Moranbacteria bacterium]